jgi:hypothetical protein
MYRRASACYEVLIGRRLAYTSRAGERKVPMEKLQAVGMSQQLRYVVSCGVPFVFEVR